MTTRVFVVDPYALHRTGMCIVLGREPDLEVVGDAGSAEEALGSLRRRPPDVATVELALPGMDGLHTIGLIRALEVPVRILVVTGRDPAEFLGPALEAGACGFLTKSASAAALANAVRRVAQGETVLPPGGRRLLAARLDGPARRERAALRRVTPRDREILALTAAGYSSKEIGRQLHTSPGAVDTARSRSMARLGLECRSDVVHFALRTGLLKRL